MQYNLHVIVVHFPVALLFMYSVIKILPFRKFFPRVEWRQIERFLLIFGMLGILASFTTGQASRRLVAPQRDLVHMHTNFASATAWFYGLLLGGEVFAVLNRAVFNRLKIRPLSWLGETIEKILCQPALSWFLALAGLICLTITGALGGAMAFGLSADPMTPYILKMLGLSV
jgi:hypothetical protein